MEHPFHNYSNAPIKPQNNEEIIQVISQRIKENYIEYDLIQKEIFTCLNCPITEPEYTFIIPVRGRKSFLAPLFEHFKRAKAEFPGQIKFVLVEHGPIPEHLRFAKKNEIDYFYLNCESDILFNKCICYNVGALFTPKPQHYIFHDLDILMTKSFFNDITSIIKRTECKVLQCYTGRRVLNCDTHISNKLISGEIQADNLAFGMPGVNLPMYDGKPSLGSKGGSILVESNVFYEAGMFDPEIFQAYSSEDNFFWEKLNSFNKIEYADEPPVELFHMWHESQFGKNPYFWEMQFFYDHFLKLNDEEKKKVIDYKSGLYNECYSIFQKNIIIHG